MLFSSQRITLYVWLYNSYFVNVSHFLQIFRVMNARYTSPRLSYTSARQSV